MSMPAPAERRRRLRLSVDDGTSRASMTAQAGCQWRFKSSAEQTPPRRTSCYAFSMCATRAAP
eukprot:12904379-Alexandrium_andersonii.AAC.1